MGSGEGGGNRKEWEPEEVVKKASLSPGRNLPDSQ